MSSSITLITNEWRLKLLAFVLAVLMLGAVAFSQNPPTTRSLTVPLDYTVREGFILINPPSKTTLTFTGLADVIARLQPENFRAAVDASKVDVGPAVKVNIRASYAGGSGVTVSQPAPIVVNVDVMQVKELPVQVGVRAAAGWAVTKAVATCPGSATPSPCKVHFDGPASWETNLTATATLPGLVDFSSKDSPNQKVVLGNSSGALDINSLNNTRPAASLDVTSVNIHVEATPGVTSSTVPLVDSQPSHGPAQGYRITGVAIAPLTIVITGDQAALARVRSVRVAPVDLSGATSDVTTQVAVNYPGGTTGVVDTATITYTISRNPNVT
jgi:YbbR domain-containing protein